jgi:hypothetical protein
MLGDLNSFMTNDILGYDKDNIPEKSIKALKKHIADQ